MKITICGSSTFQEKMIEYKKRLEGLGHVAIVHPDYEGLVEGTKQELSKKMEQEHWKAKIENDYIKWYYNSIVESDAILVLNFNKRGIENYIGGNTLMEIAFAYVNNKTIFLINSIPEEVSYADEIKAMISKVLNDNLEEICT